jgi:hypothetical protein
MTVKTFLNVLLYLDVADSKKSSVQNILFCVSYFSGRFVRRTKQDSMNSVAYCCTAEKYNSTAQECCDSH